MLAHSCPSQPTPPCSTLYNLYPPSSPLPQPPPPPVVKQKQKKYIQSKEGVFYCLTVRMDTTFSLSSSSSFSPSNFFGSSGLGADANPSFPYTPSSLGRRWRGSCRETPRFFCESIFGCGGNNHHYLDACFLCKKTISANEDIFMYRGNEPFCSNECRGEQMEMDQALENNRKKFSSTSSSSSSINNSSSTASSTIKHKPSLIIHENSRSVHAVVANY